METDSPIKSRRSSKEECSINNLNKANHQSTSNHVEEESLKYIRSADQIGCHKVNDTCFDFMTYDLVSLCADSFAKYSDRTSVTIQAVKAETPE
jgi:hypothetical protein